MMSATDVLPQTSRPLGSGHTRGEDSASEIRATSSPRCLLCGGEGESLYRGLVDRLFGAPGLWNVVRCPNQACGLLWLDPMPVAQDIGKAYARYYTHTVEADARRAGRLRRLLHEMKEAHQSIVYGYPSNHGSVRRRVLGRTLRLFPVRRGAADNDVRFLDAHPGGLVLDVGCGTGEWLLAMQGRGWNVEGIEFDEDAVAVARGLGLEVRSGSLEQQHYPAESFDAVTLSHVIEHVPDPAATIAECSRVLKHGGKLVIATPNTASLSHRFFGRSWRGLEPPRHLSILSMQSLRRALEIAGFQGVVLHPQFAPRLVHESVLLSKGVLDHSAMLQRRDLVASLSARAFSALEVPLVGVRPHLADCMTAVARKD